MKTTVSLLFLLFAGAVATSQTIYTKTFGSPKNPAAIFLHGGPGYNSAAFEATTAQQLADQGFYVIVYDRRGEGRSADPAAAFTFDQTFSDINEIYSQQKIKKATIVGHSFGGVVGTLFAEKYPEKVASLIHVAAPVSMQQTFTSIIDRSRKLYESKNDTTNLNYLTMLDNMDHHSMEYASYCFGHAMQNGFYTTPNPTEKSKAIYAAYRQSPLISYASKMTFEAPTGFHQNEKYTDIDLTANLISLRKKKMPVFALYGKDDGLYSAAQVEALQKIIGSENVLYLENCSHNVFIDQQDAFLAAVKKWAR